MRRTHVVLLRLAVTVLLWEGIAPAVPAQSPSPIGELEIVAEGFPRVIQFRGE